MRSLNPGLFVAGGLIVALMAWKSLAEPSPGIGVQGTTPGNRLTTHCISAGAGGDRIVVVDPDLKTMAVYRIGRERGEITLDSVRHLSWDLRMLHFNSATPTPDDVRVGLER